MIGVKEFDVLVRRGDEVDCILLTGTGLEILEVDLALLDGSCGGRAPDLDREDDFFDLALQNTLQNISEPDFCNSLMR